jgi:cyanophycinase
MKRLPSLHALLLLTLTSTPPLLAADAPPAPRLRPSGIDGSLVLCGSPNMPEAVFTRFMKLAGDDKANLVVVLEGGSNDTALESWNARKPSSVFIADLRPDKYDLDSLLAKLDKATGVWIGMSDTAAARKFLLEPRIEPAIRNLLKRGGVLGIDGCGCGVVGKSPNSADTDKKKQQSLDLLPGTFLLPNFAKADDSSLKLLFETLDQNPGTLGIGIAPGTALVVKGRDLAAVGDGVVTIGLSASTTRKRRTIELKPGSLQDLTALRRASIARAEPPFPPKQAAVPNVPSGSLVIIGGGGAPPDVMKKFIDLAGGPDELIVVLPQANPDPIPKDLRVAMFQKAGAKNVEVLHGRQPEEIDSPENLALLKKAKAIWFDGGRQWRFVDSFEGTKVLDLIRDVLKRGGVIGGSSAGASIQAEYMVRGSPLGNLEMMAEGYERGLGFLPGVAVDQHFTQRKRFDDMTALMKAYPQLLGIGIDESTAIVVTCSTAEVMGKGHVHFYDRNKPVEDGKPDYEVLKAGDRYDLKTRKALPADQDK